MTGWWMRIPFSLGADLASLLAFVIDPLLLLGISFLGVSGGLCLVTVALLSCDYPSQLAGNRVSFAGFIIIGAKHERYYCPTQCCSCSPSTFVKNRHCRLRNNLSAGVNEGNNFLRLLDNMLLNLQLHGAVV
jgi:hypothetical protein